MAENKSIMLYLDTLKQWEMLTDEQAGILIKALLQYASGGEQLCTDDGMVSMAFSFITAQIDRDNEKWNATCQKRSESARKRWEANHANDADCMQNMQMDANDADTDTVTDTVTDTEKDKESVCADKPRRPRAASFKPPTVEMVQAYCRERKNCIDAQRFVDFYTANGWIQGKGKPIKDWRAAVRLWEQRENQFQARSPAKTNQPRDSSFDLSDFDKLVNNF